MNTCKITSAISSLLVVALALASFMLSYENLKALAVDTGAISANLAWLWPFIIDGALIVFSLAVLRNSLSGESIIWPMTMVIMFSALSVGMNVLHASDDLVARVIAAIAPVALLLSFETFMSQIKSDVRRAGLVKTLAQLGQKIKSARAELEQMTSQAQADADQMVTDAQTKVAAMTSQLDDMTSQLDQVTAKRDQVQVDLDRLMNERREVKRALRDEANGQMTSTLEQANGTRRGQIKRRREDILDLLSGQPGLSYGQIADAVDACGSAKTAQRDVEWLMDKELVERAEGGALVVKNGAGH